MARIACLVADLSRCRKTAEATRQTTNDITKFCLDMGFHVFDVVKCQAFKYFKTLFLSLSQLINYDFLIVPYPLFGNPLRSSTVIEGIALTLLEKLTKTILYVYDLPIDQSILAGLQHYVKREALIRERHILSRAYKILCFNEEMKRILMKRYGIPESKLVRFELLDYGSNMQAQLAVNPSKYDKVDRVRVVYVAGDYSSPKVRNAVLDFIQHAPSSERIHFMFVGFRGEFIDCYGKPNVAYVGGLRGSDYIRFVSEAHFGLVLKTTPYNEYGSTSKFSSYMLVGLPVLVPRSYRYLSRIVSKFDVGIVYDSPSDIPELLEGYTSRDFSRMSMNAYALGLKLRKGFFFKKAVLNALK